MNNNNWHRWANIFAWHDRFGFYVRPSVFDEFDRMFTDITRDLRAKTASMNVFESFTQNSFEIESDDLINPVVFLNASPYIRSDLACAWLNDKARRYEEPSPDNQKSFREWYANCATELWRISDLYQNGIPINSTLKDVFSNDFFRQIGIYLKFRHGGDLGMESNMTSVKFAQLRPDLFPEDRYYSGNKDVYFIQGCHTKRIKIGISNDAKSRIKQIQSSEPLSLLGVIIGGGKALESELHKRFKAFQIHNEWFSPSPELLTFIGELAWQTAKDTASCERN